MRKWLIGTFLVIIGASGIQAQEVTTLLRDNLDKTQEAIIGVFPFKRIENFFVSPLQQPTQIMAPFGEVRQGYIHQGIDLRAEIGTPLFAIADGIVTKAAPDSKGINVGGGHMIFIDHGEGIESRYMHLSDYAVKTGDRVKAGQVIGFSGMSGDSTGPLLHYEYRMDNLPIDPTFILEINGMLIHTPISFTNSFSLPSNQGAESFLAKQS